MVSLPALTDDERRDLTDPRSEYTAEERVVVAMTFILCGEKSALAAHRASKALDREIPAGTLRQWRRRDWWPLAEAAGKRRLQEDLENGYTRILHLTESNILDRIENGDSRPNPLAGRPVLLKAADREEDEEWGTEPAFIPVPVTLRDLIGAHAVVSDKRAMLRGEPTSRKEDTGLALAMKLAEAFHRMGQEALDRKDGAVDGEFTVLSNTVVEDAT